MAPKKKNARRAAQAVQPPSTPAIAVERVPVSPIDLPDPGEEQPATVEQEAHEKAESADQGLGATSIGDATEDVERRGEEDDLEAGAIDSAEPQPTEATEAVSVDNLVAAEDRDADGSPLDPTSIFVGDRQEKFVEPLDDPIPTPDADAEVAMVAQATDEPAVSMEEPTRISPTDDIGAEIRTRAGLLHQGEPAPVEQEVGDARQDDDVRIAEVEPSPAAAHGHNRIPAGDEQDTAAEEKQDNQSGPSVQASDHGTPQVVDLTNTTQSDFLDIRTITEALPAAPEVAEQELFPKRPFGSSSQEDDVFAAILQPEEKISTQPSTPTHHTEKASSSTPPSHLKQNAIPVENKDDLIDTLARLSLDAPADPGQRDAPASSSAQHPEAKDPETLIRKDESAPGMHTDDVLTEGVEPGDQVDLNETEEEGGIDLEGPAGGVTEYEQSFLPGVGSAGNQDVRPVLEESFDKEDVDSRYTEGDETDLFGGKYDRPGGEFDWSMGEGQASVEIAKDQSEDGQHDRNDITEPTNPSEMRPDATYESGEELFGGRSDGHDVFPIGGEEETARIYAGSAIDSSLEAAENGEEDLDLDGMGVPEGWLDVDGSWNWYTEEERLEVGRGMLVKRPSTVAAQDSAHPLLSSPFGSSRAAPAPDPWSPPAITYVPSKPSAPSTTYNQSSVSNQYSPYAPTQSAGQYTSAYAPAMSSYTAAPPVYGQRSVTASATAPRPSSPAPLARTATPTAYDPPILTAARALHRAPPVAVMSNPFGNSVQTPSGFNPLASPLVAPPPPSRSVPPQGLPSTFHSRPSLALRNASSTLNAALAPTAFDPPMMPLNRYASQARLRATPQPIMSQSGPTATPPPPPPQRQQSPLPPNYAQLPPANQLPYVVSAPTGLPHSSIGFPSQYIPQQETYGARQTLSPPPPIPQLSMGPYPSGAVQAAPIVLHQAARQPSAYGLQSSTYTTTQNRDYSAQALPPPSAPSSRVSRDGRDEGQPFQIPVSDRPLPRVASPSGPGAYTISQVSQKATGISPPDLQGSFGADEPDAWPSPASQRNAKHRTPLRQDTYSSPSKQVTNGFNAPERRVDTSHQRFGSSGSALSFGGSRFADRPHEFENNFTEAPYTPPGSARQEGSMTTAHEAWHGHSHSSSAETPVVYGELSGQSGSLVGYPKPTTHYDPYATAERPSLDDDLLRRGFGTRVASVSFGPRGQIVTAFQPRKEGNVPSLTAASAYGETSLLQLVAVRQLSSLTPDASATSAPIPKGPFIHDPSSAKTAANDKKRRDAILAYLDSQIEVTSTGIPYLALKAGDTSRRQRAEAGLVLLRLIRNLILHDGSLLTKDLDATLSVLSPLHLPDMQAPPGGNRLPAESHGQDRAATSEDLAELSGMLAHGKNAEAVELAISRQLWSHALIVSSAIGPESWAQTIKAFSASALAGRQDQDGAIVLKASYILVANSGTEKATAALRENLSDEEVLVAWQGVAATILGTGRGQAGILLSELGDRLRARKRLEASHVCFLLSAATSASPAQAAVTAKAIPYGHDSLVFESEALLQSELVEYAYSMRPTLKGTDASSGIEALIPHKINKMAELFEVGRYEEGERYFDSISTILRGTRGIAPSRVDHLSRRMAYIRAIMQGAESTDISGKKLLKPNLQNVGSWFEGRLTKFIAGEEPEAEKSEATPKERGKDADSAPIGPFSHYSSIAADAPAGGNLARATSSYDLNNRFVEPAPPVPRSGSAMAYRQPPIAAPPYRPSSAMAYRPSGPQFPALTAIDSRARSPVPQELATEVPVPMPRRESSKTPSMYDEDDTAKPDEIATPMQPSLAVPSWGQSYDFEDTGGDAETPDAPSSLSSGGGGFLNPMQAMIPAYGMPAVTSTSTTAETPSSYQDEEDDDELGLGNSTAKPRSKALPADEQKPDSAAPVVDAYIPALEDKKIEPVEEKKDVPVNAASTGSWIGKFWGGSKTEKKPGPIRAKLGEETSMVFDPVQKRWVAKGAAGQAEAPKLPPPPPRSTTASPAVQSTASTPAAGPAPFSRPPSTAPGPSGLSSAPPAGPPTRANGPPPPSGGPPRPSSSAAGPPSRSTANANTTDPPVDALGPPPPRKAGTGGAKKNIRSRYVDVFQQP